MSTIKVTNQALVGVSARVNVNLRVVAFIRDFCDIGSGEFHCTIGGSNFRIGLEIKVDDCNAKSLKNLYQAVE